MEPSHRVGDRVIPYPENIRSSSLRETVESLADVETPVQIHFDEKNPIPEKNYRICLPSVLLL